MAFEPNYGRDRAERQIAARARTEEKLKTKGGEGCSVQSQARGSRSPAG